LLAFPIVFRRLGVVFFTAGGFLFSFRSFKSGIFLSRVSFFYVVFVLFLCSYLFFLVYVLGLVSLFARSFFLVFLGFWVFSALCLSFSSVLFLLPLTFSVCL